MKKNTICKLFMLVASLSFSASAYLPLPKKTGMLGKKDKEEKKVVQQPMKTMSKVEVAKPNFDDTLLQKQEDSMLEEALKKSVEDQKNSLGNSKKVPINQMGAREIDLLSSQMQSLDLNQYESFEETMSLFLSIVDEMKKTKEINSHSFEYISHIQLKLKNYIEDQERVAQLELPLWEKAIALAQIIIGSELVETIKIPQDKIIKDLSIKEHQEALDKKLKGRVDEKEIQEDLDQIKNAQEEQQKKESNFRKALDNIERYSYRLIEIKKSIEIQKEDEYRKKEEVKRINNHVSVLFNQFNILQGQFREILGQEENEKLVAKITNKTMEINKQMQDTKKEVVLVEKNSERDNIKHGLDAINSVKALNLSSNNKDTVISNIIKDLTNSFSELTEEVTYLQAIKNSLRKQY